MNSKTQLAIALSKLEVFSSPKPTLEQYPTDSEIAGEILWTAHMNGDIEDKTVADLGCGTGILGIGALLLGAKTVFFIDKDTAAIDVLGNNLKRSGIEHLNKRTEIIDADVSEFKKRVDLVIQNPPFGTREKHSDKKFLEKAISISKKIYSFHKTITVKFVEAFAKDNSFDITGRWHFQFPLKQTLTQHKKKIHRIEVTCFRLEKT